MHYRFLSKGRRRVREGLTSLSDCVIMNYKKKDKEEPNMFFLKKKRENENIETTLKEYLSQTSDMYRQEIGRAHV